MKMKKILFASAFSTALLASTAIQAQSVGVDAGADAGVSADVGTSGTGVGVDAGVDAGVGASVGTSGASADADGDASVEAGTSGTEAGAGVDTGVSADVGTGSGTEASTDVGVDAEAEVGTAADDVDTQVETGATGSAHASTTLSGMGIPTDGFFADETMTELATEAQIRTTFEALPPEQQAQLDAECIEVSMASSPDNELMAELCAAIEAGAL